MTQSSDKPIFWLRAEIKTPPFSAKARLEAGFLLRQLQQGFLLTLPHNRPMPSIGSHCHELRIQDSKKTWRIIYRLDSDAILICEVFAKKTQSTPKHIIKICQNRLWHYDEITKEES